MAFAFDGFSIREYTSKMRSVDVLKCWPFSITNSSDVSKEDLKSCLPPMTVPKFRRRPEQLEAVRSDHDDRRKSEQQLPDGEISGSESESLKSEKSISAEEDRLVCPVCRVFKAATLTAVNAHIDGCLAQTMREERRHMKIMSLKPKSKAPKKKRSIAEIFEVEVEQPPMENPFKIWPLNKNPDEVSITVTEFRWCSRQIEALGSNQSEGESSRNGNESAKSDEGRGGEDEKLEMVCPVSGAVNASTLTAVNDSIDVQAMTEERRHLRMNFKPKPKVPKKRSIAEILTVAPQIEAKCNELIEIDEEVEEEEKSVGDDDSSRPTAAPAVFSTTHSKRNKNKNKKKKKTERRWKKKLKKKKKLEKHSGGTVTLNNDKETLNQNKKKKKKLLHNGLNAKKDDTYRREVKTPAKSSRKLKGTIGGKRAALDDINASAHKKKASLKRASIGKKREATENYSTHMSGKASSGCNVQDGIEDKTRDAQEQILARHVTFSNKDNILGPKKRSSSDEKVFSSDGQAASSVKEQSSASDETACLEVNRRDSSITFNMDRGKEFCPVVESKQFSTAPERVPPKGFLRSRATSDKKKHLVEKTESLIEVASDDNDNLHLFDTSNTTALHCSSQSSISRSLSAYQEGGISSVSTRVGESGAHHSPGKFMDHHGDSAHQVSAADSDASMRTFVQSSLHHTLYSQGSEKSLSPSQTYEDNSQTLDYRPLSHMFPANSSMDENFFGLPLNSQGELINFSSCSKGGINQSETSSMLRSSSSRLLFDNIAYRSSHEYLSINESHLVQKTLSQGSVNKFPHYPARLGVTNQLQGSGRADVHQFNTYRDSNQFVYPLDSELKPMKYPFVEQNQYDQVQNHKRNEMIHLKKGSDLSSQSSTQPTMRLMGKDVPIGRSIKEEDVWAEQQCIRSHSSRDAALENSSLETCSKLDHLRGSPLQSTAMINGPEFEFPQPFLDLQTNYVPQNGNWGFSKTASCYTHPITHAHTSGSASNKARQDSPGQSVCGPKFQGLGSHLQAQLATCNYNQHTCQSNGDLYARKKLPLVTKSAFEFPLVHPAFGEHAKASWFQSSNGSSPPWLLAQEKLPGTLCQQIPGPSSICLPHTQWGGRFPTPVNHSILNCSPVNYCHMKTPISPASVVQPPLLPRRPAINLSSTLRSGCRNEAMVNDRVILENRATNDHGLCNNTRKRPAANIHGSTKLIKLNEIEVRENLNGVPGLIQENTSCEFQRTTRTVEVAPQGDSSRRKCCCLNEAQNMMSKTYLGLQISGPGRPSPGTGHIRKPSPNVAATTDTDRDLDFQRKLTKIYEF